VGVLLLLLLLPVLPVLLQVLLQVLVLLPVGEIRFSDTGECDIASRPSTLACCCCCS
jgi:hypothetical protein